MSLIEQDSVLLQQSLFSTELETLGFDLSSGSKWIYPENYTRRDYQFSIVQTALYNNTLVCLPTGLGKTFIAAVVMYNFWRWYPRARVVFLAPTKPLVAQQMKACYDIMGIPSEETIELTGSIVQNKRRQAWLQKRVIFATPQTFQKDLQNDLLTCNLIKCVVIDEAHRALGKHSYCEIIRMVNEKTKFFRVLALSATPGNKIDHVCEVIQNLLISKVELRDDTSPDIIPYINERSIEKIIVGLSKEQSVIRDKYISIMDPFIRILISNNVIQGNVSNITKGRIFMLMKQFENRHPKGNNHGIIMKSLNILLTMYHAYELLVKHGLRAFYNFYSNHADKYWIEGESSLQLLLEDIKTFIGPFPKIHMSPDKTIVPNNIVFGHNKFHKLRELLVEHFKLFSPNNSSRAIVFVEYRDIVNEIYVLLLQARPLIRPQMFVGQAGQKRKVQLAALENFRNNTVNVLISTSVGEEGLDVGEVDLIICFDVSTSTPIRLVQRMGRTGRKQCGRVILLLTEGKEVQTLNQAMSKKESLKSMIMEHNNISASLYRYNPRMIPSNINPECFPMFFKVQKISGTQKVKTAVEWPTSNDNSNMNDLNSYQTSMRKFLFDRSQFINEQLVSNFGDRNEMVSRVVIDSKDIEILMSDSSIIDFLTLSVMKKSKQDVQNLKLIKFSIKEVPERLCYNTLRNFSIPSLKCLDCINNLKTYHELFDDNNEVIKADESLINSINTSEFTCESTKKLKNFDIIESKYHSSKMNRNCVREFTINSLAQIEVDFDCILDEYNESETIKSNSSTIYKYSDSSTFSEQIDSTIIKLTNKRSANYNSSSSMRKKQKIIAMKTSNDNIINVQNNVSSIKKNDQDKKTESKELLVGIQLSRTVNEIQIEKKMETLHCSVHPSVLNIRSVSTESNLLNTYFETKENNMNIIHNTEKKLDISLSSKPCSSRTVYSKNDEKSNFKHNSTENINNKYSIKNISLHEKLKKKRKVKLKTDLMNEFIDNLAEVSTDMDTSISSSEADDDNNDLDNFISYTQDVTDSVNMKAYYLQSVNQTIVNNKPFLFKKRKPLEYNLDIYSQAASQADDSYLYDSFCVKDVTEKIDDGTCSCNSSYNKDEQQEEDRCLQKYKKKRLRKYNEFDSNTSEDEIEIMRKQICE